MRMTGMDRIKTDEEGEHQMHVGGLKEEQRGDLEEWSGTK